MISLSRAVAVAVPAALLLATVAAAAMATPAQAQADPQRGRELFERNCAMCHGPDAAGMVGMHPSLRGAVQRLSRAGVEVTIRKGRNTTPPMPSFDRRLSNDQIQDVIAYLDTLPVGPRNFGPEGSGMMDGNGMMGGGRMMSGWWSLLLLGAIGVFVLLGLVALLFLLTWWFRSSRPGSKSRALEILKERYARGEIEHDEFEQRRATLER